MQPFNFEVYWIVIEISIRGIRVSKGEHLPEMRISMFSNNRRVNLEFHT
jgi:hypothetical protein